ncbi:hypothetical protein ACCO45_002404 [Purpureocillium lilacinum]|uniref:Uncharacterized protein n=1 Tax=Purpureocillium lilacinum TaxID=33203 RepID=A0ACC4E9T7_PURLI
MDSLDATTPTNRKRSLPEADIESIATPASLKRAKLEHVGAESPSTPKALTAIANAISGVLGFSRQPQKAADGVAQPTAIVPNGVNGNGLVAGPRPPPPSAAPKPRPAIKLAALKGTKWDTGNIGSAKLARKPSTASAKIAARPSPAATEPGTPSGRGKAAQNLILGSTGKIKAPKGILTPTKRRGRPPKSVTFNRGLDGEVYFQDLPKTPSGRKRGPKPKVEEDDDEIRCAICAKADSKAPNEIILCDNCDFAVHQECYEVPEIPEGDWLCKSCAQEDVLKTPVKPADSIATSKPEAEVPDIPNLSHHLRSFQRVLLDRCLGQRRIKMFGQEETYEKAKQLVEQTVVAGEGNSMLLIGPRAKHIQMVENIVTDLAQAHGHLFHVVRLNGFIHTDDKVALKEIWRQLGKEMDVEEDLVNRVSRYGRRGFKLHTANRLWTNYADTMASLLALLSHPSEIMGTDESVTSQSVIFVVDEFDMFAAHPRQTLLYNLFDIAQSRKAPIAVLGCTTRLDVVEMLEKRVKSRFSHRYVYLSLPRALPAYWQICRQGLMIDRTDVEREGLDVSLEGYDDFHKYWTRKIEQVDVVVPDGVDTTAVSPIGEGRDAELSDDGLRGDVPGGAGFAAAGVVDAVGAGPRPLDRGGQVGHCGAHRHGQLCHGVRRVQLAGGKAAGAVGDVGDAGDGGGTRAWSRGVAGIAWERLISLGMLVPAGIGGSRALGHGGLDGKMWKVEVMLEEIPAAVKLSNVLAKWCREI